MSSAPVVIVVDNIINIVFLLLLFLEKIRFCIACELSAQQTIHMKCQALFSQIKNSFLL